MSLARIYSGVTGLGQTIIRKLTDVGGPPASRVSEELDNIIAWAKDAPRCIHRNITGTGNVGTGLDSLHSFSLPANSLATNGDWVRFTYSGAFATNDNDKRIRVSIDNQTLEDPGLFDFDAGLWRVTGEYVRTTATTVRGICLTTFGEALVMDEGVVAGTPDIIYVVRDTSLTVANLNSNAVTMLVQAEGTANDDIVQTISVIELCQQ